jgi:hypothetical protein
MCHFFILLDQIESDISFYVGKRKRLWVVSRQLIVIAE